MTLGSRVSIARHDSQSLPSPQNREHCSFSTPSALLLITLLLFVGLLAPFVTLPSSPLKLQNCLEAAKHTPVVSPLLLGCQISRELRQLLSERLNAPGGSVFHVHEAFVRGGRPPNPALPLTTLHAPLWTSGILPEFRQFLSERLKASGGNV
ncbi:hypothetical protein C8R44DRAFT_745592 [Mycena epipterygia]|nr:hypothetical protein C8R44DRAFT_745592 [Mycena epipterygia]